MLKTLLMDFKRRDGVTIPKGTEVQLELGEKIIGSVNGERKLALRPHSAKKYFGSPFTKLPTMATMERWSNDGVARTYTGQRTEPDGTGSDGSVSWLVAYGLI